MAGGITRVAETSTPVAASRPDAADRIADLARQISRPAERGQPVSHIVEQRAIANIICSFSGDQLKALIVKLDRKSKPSFEDVVYHVISDDKVRGQILDHVKKFSTNHELCIISDYDDTAMASHDTRKNAFVGVGQLYQELDRAKSGTAGDLHIVSARPGIIANKPRDTITPENNFPNASVEASDWGPYITNILSAIWRFITFQGWGHPMEDAIVEGKIRNVEHMLALHPGQKFVFFGDTVQYDPEVYGKIRAKYPDRVAAIVIHTVPDEEPVTKDNPSRNRPERLVGMLTNNNAGESARKLQKAGLLDAAAVARVDAAMKRELEAMDGKKASAKLLQEAPQSTFFAAPAAV